MPIDAEGCLVVHAHLPAIYISQAGLLSVWRHGRLEEMFGATENGTQKDRSSS
jgi:hypothetical protein